jgi:hypothetical protein
MEQSPLHNTEFKLVEKEKSKAIWFAVSSKWITENNICITPISNPSINLDLEPKTTPQWMSQLRPWPTIISPGPVNLRQPTPSMRSLARGQTHSAPTQTDPSQTDNLQVSPMPRPKLLIPHRQRKPSLKRLIGSIHHQPRWLSCNKFYYNG